MGKDKKDEPKKEAFVFICSKLACDNAYTTYKTGRRNDLPRKDRQVLIKGGSGVVGKNLITPHGVSTKITTGELEMLEKNCPAFNKHVTLGFLKVLKKDPSPKEISSMADDMPNDKGRQKTKKDVKQKEKKV
jgi:hypothetical protein